MSEVKFPKVVQRGHSIVKIYKTPSRGRDLFTVVHYVGEKRVREYLSDYEVALTRAQAKATQLSAGELKVLTLTNQEQLIYVRAAETMKPWGIPLDVAAMRLAEILRILEDDSPIEAAHYFKKHHPTKLPRKPVGEVVAEMLEAKESDGMSEVYLKDLRVRLARFAEKFPGPILSITTAEVEDFLRDLKKPGPQGKDKKPVTKSLTGRTRNNYRRAIGTLFHFAEARGYLVKGNGCIEAVAVAREEDGDIGIFTPAELRQLFETAQSKPELLPFLAIGAFAGLRHAEITRLEWPEIRLDDGFIEVKARKAKTASRRLVPITPNLRAWLEKWQRVSGPVVHHENMPNQIQWLAYHAKVSWKQNALRHSFISYRLAQVQNTAQVALEAGNSPQMVFQHYRELVRPADADKWFSISPDSVPKPESKIIPLTNVA